jgi:hypothetical protein
MRGCFTYTSTSEEIFRLYRQALRLAPRKILITAFVAISRPSLVGRLFAYSISDDI